MSMRPTIGAAMRNETPRVAGSPRLILAVVCMVLLLDALDLSITQVALPRIGSDLDVSASVLPWVANAYVLTYGGLLLLGGRVSDLAGRRATLVAGLVLFGAGSLVSGLAPGAGVLIGARALQGIGAALTVPAAVATIAVTFPQGPDRQRALGVFAAFGSAGFSVGLILGGVLTSSLGWRAIFWLKVPVVIAVLVAAVLVIPNGTRRAAAERSYDLIGALTGTLGPLLLAFAVTSAAAPSRNLPVIAISAALGAAVLVLFVLRERAAADPLLPLSLFANRTVRVADLASLTVLAAPFGFAFIVTTYLQDVSGYSPLRTGLAVLPGGVLSAVISRYVAPVVIGRFGLRVAAAGGLLVVAAGFAWLVRLNTAPSYLGVILPASLVSLGLGMGLAYPVSTVAAVTDVEEPMQGVAAGVQNAALQIGGGVGFALVSAFVGASSGASGGAGRESASVMAAVHHGALAGAALPLLGALVALTLPTVSAERRPENSR